MADIRVYRTGYKHGLKNMGYMHHRRTRYLQQESYNHGYAEGQRRRREVEAEAWRQDLNTAASAKPAARL